MSPGNNKSNPNSLDNFIERLNKGFSRLLGKKGKPVKPKQTSNITFAIIILLSSMLLWACTGFYFLGENEYGLIFINGRVADVKHGIRVGLTLPYPFGGTEIIDGAPSEIISIGVNPANAFVVLDKNLSPIAITAKFNYQVTNPRILFLNHMQDQDEFDHEILWLVQSKITNFFATQDINELKNTNLTVLSNEIEKLLAPTLDSYGITLPRFAIISLQEQSKPVIVQLPESATSSGVKNDESFSRVFSREVNRDRNGMDD